ncbi:hypothetical protein B0H34DRAFT_696475 [Crassisporium funariophilum]|nr:hypothetical protein B0H34DRAFT_696475 [Crassisporium funariophilum]
MATTRIPTNLKERIAAIERQNAESTAPVQRATSPTPSVASNSSNSSPSTAALRDKIARFERKGGVPVPRGSFGLGVPPPMQGPRRQGELYGNRIPAPARSVSSTVPSRAASPFGSSTMGSPESSPTADNRRSFSMSSVMSDDPDDGVDYTPISSPTFAFPPDSPESTSSVSFTPEASPTLSIDGGPPGFKPNMKRGTSFAMALEMARKTESAKQDMHDPTTPTQRTRSLDHEDGVESPDPTPAELTPAIVVSSENAVPVGILQDSPTSTSQFVVPAVALPSENVPSKQGHPSDPVIDINGAQITEVSAVEDKGVQPVRVAPLAVRKRAPVEPVKMNSDRGANVVLPEAQVVIEHQEVKAEAVIPFVSLTEVGKEEVLDSKVTLQPPSPVKVEELAKLHGKSVPLPKTTRTIPPPEIIIDDEQALESKQNTTVIECSEPQTTVAPSRKVVLTLDEEKLNNDALMSPPLASGMMTGMSITDVLSNYFTGGGNGEFRTTTPPPVPLRTPDFDSPPATLAYDNPERASTLPQSFLSPPATGFLSAVPSSGASSMGSMSSIGSRPMSMIETSPSRLARALRMTPATSRGVPMFLPPNSSRPRKSDFVYFPPTPEAEQTDFGSATLHKASQSLSLGSRPRRGSDPETVTDENAAQGTFTTVVHRKVRETPASAAGSSSNKLRLAPETPQVRRVKRATILEPPLSPGQGELVALLQEAVFLEEALNGGELPTESTRRLEEEERQRQEQEAVAAAAEAKARDEERSRIAFATAQLQAKRDEPTPGRLKHTFLIPLSKARSVNRKEVSTSRAEGLLNISQEDQVIRPKSAGVLDSTSRAAKTDIPHKAQAQRSKTPEAAATATNDLPAKSPKSSRFHSFRRLGSMSRPNTFHGPSGRNSNSTSSEISSEDSAPVAITPPENNLEFSLTPKSTGSIGRATSFAEKMWSRARTKSSGSTLSTASEVTDRMPESSPEKSPAAKKGSIGPPPAFELPPIPLISSSFDKEEPTKVMNPPTRSTSLRHPMNLPPIPNSTPAPQLPNITSAALFDSYNPAHQSETSSQRQTFLSPALNDSTRPSSWISLSSAGSLPSPLFDKDLFDAFPSVPGTIPIPATTIGHNFPHRHDLSLATASKASFDSALLSSAIHLASTHKSTTPKSNLKPLPSDRIATKSGPRRSGESAR